MREIKFRGKRIDNGEWVYGWIYGDKVKAIITLIKNNQMNEVETFDTSRVIPETVGQYTGLKDRDGFHIYEGDVVSNGKLITYSTGQERWFGDVGVVQYDTKNGCLVINNDDGPTKRLTVKVIKNNQVQVIGNIYDNPELMGSEE